MVHFLIFLLLLTNAWAQNHRTDREPAPISRPNLEVIPQDQQNRLTNRAPSELFFRKLRQHKQVTTAAVQDGVQIHAEVARMDGDGFRVVPGEEKKGAIDGHVVIGGCSWAFGVGVPDEAVVTSVLAKLRPREQVLNIGVRGGGTNEQNYLWQYADFRHLIRAEKGIYVYLYHPFQHERFQRVPRYYHWADAWVPRYEFDGNEVKFVGLNQDDWLFQLTDWFKRKNLVMYWLRFYSWFNWIHLRNTHADMAKHLAQLKRPYLKQYPQGRFVVAFVGEFNDPDYWSESTSFVETVRNEGVEFWDIGSKPAGKEWMLPEGHPNSALHELFAQRLNEKINAIGR